MKSISVILRKVIILGSMGIAFGSASAGTFSRPLVIEQFSDFECSYCAESNETMKLISEHYRDKILLVFRSLPLTFHRNSFIAAKVYAAISLQDPKLANTWKDLIFENQKRLTNEGEAFVYEVANQIGVNLARLRNDVESTVVAKMLEKDKERASQMDLKGTPSFLVGPEKVTGAQSFSDFKKIIDRQLKSED